MKMEQLTKGTEIMLEIEEINAELEMLEKTKESHGIIIQSENCDFRITLSGFETIKNIIQDILFTKSEELIKLYKEFEEL